MRTSKDGGQPWGAGLGTAGKDQGIGGVPVVKPGGKVIVPILGFYGYVTAFTSINGGKSWTKAVNVASYINHAEAGGLRSAGLISSAVDAAGKVYVMWPDCRFRTNWSSNGIVYSTSGTRTTRAAGKRVPIAPVTRPVGHLITGAAVVPAAQGTTAHT